jgi:hypothetical protein
LRLNLFVIVGACLVFAGLFTTAVLVFRGGLGSSMGVFGVMMPSVLSLVLGIALIKVGTRPKRFSRRR